MFPVSIIICLFFVVFFPFLRTFLIIFSVLIIIVEKIDYPTNDIFESEVAEKGTGIIGSCCLKPAVDRSTKVYIVIYEVLYFFFFDFILLS